MTFRERLKNPLVQQYALEIALPLAGYLFFDWSIQIIIAFYFIDYFGSEIARHRRHYKILKHWNESMKQYFVSIVFSLFFFLLLAFLCYNIMSGTKVTEEELNMELIDFMKSEGWFLIPLVYFANYMKDTMMFYAPRRFAKFNYRKTIKAYFLEIVIMAVLVVAGVFLYSSYEINDILALLLFIIIKLCFDLILKRKLEKFAKSA